MSSHPAHAGRDGNPAPDPDFACASCHREIYNRYRVTPMANASGLAIDGFIPGDFTHAESGVRYRVTEQSGRVLLSYERENASPDKALEGKQELRYFLGSGKRGRTYLFEQSGYWFESPINWYGKKQLWDMAPNLQFSREAPLNLPVDPGCLRCHASSVARSLPEARNLYAGEPFSHGGITCAACHGDSRAHVTSQGRAPMLNINALPPVRRDSICLNCHLEGQAAVPRNSRELEDFTPGDDLFDYALFFVYRKEDGSGGRATSQWEALLRSQCKTISGSRLTCTTCHDPHGSPPPETKIAYYRQKCLECHSNPAFAENHHRENPDCTACHMARPPSTDIAHEQITDHWIRKRIPSHEPAKPQTGILEPIGGMVAGDRDLGIAYAQMAVRGDPDAAKRGLRFLEQAEHSESGAARDHELLSQLGFLKQVNGQPAAAAEEYELALQADPYDNLAAGDLALLKVKQGAYPEALKLLKASVDHDPSNPAAGLNLAVVQCGLGEKEPALATLGRILEFSPDEQRASALSRAIRSGAHKCGSR